MSINSKSPSTEAATNPQIYSFLAPSELYKCRCLSVGLSVSFLVFSAYEAIRAFIIDGLIYPMMLINYRYPIYQLNESILLIELSFFF